MYPWPWRRLILLAEILAIKSISPLPECQPYIQFCSDTLLVTSGFSISTTEIRQYRTSAVYWGVVWTSASKGYIWSIKLPAFNYLKWKWFLSEGGLIRLEGFRHYRPPFANESSLVFGISFWVVRRITDYLIDRQQMQRVKLGNCCCSDWVPVPTSWPQEIKLWPLHFALMANGLYTVGISLWKHLMSSEQIPSCLPWVIHVCC